MSVFPVSIFHSLVKRTVPFFLFLIVLSSRISAQVGLLDSIRLDTLSGFTSLEEALKHPEEVIKLELRKKKLKAFPPEIFQFTNLQYLDLSKNNITEIPAGIAA